MRRRPGALLLLATIALPLLAGCFASVDVTKVPAGETSSTKPGVAGIRYSLPATFLVVEPDPAKAGSYTVETKLFPDTTQTYAIASTAYLSTATLNVELSEGLLTKVTISQNTGDIGEEALKGISEVVKTDLEQRKQEKEAAETARKEAAKELETLEAAVTKAEDELLIARRAVAEWELLVSTPGGEANATYQLGLRQAKVDLAKAEIALQRANQALAERQAQTSGGSSGGSQDLPAGSGGGAPEGGNPAAAPPQAPSAGGAPATPGAPAQPPPGGAPAAPGASANPATNPPALAGQGPAGGGGGAVKAAVASTAPTRKGPVLYRLVDTCDVWSTDEVFKTCKVELVPVQWNPQDPKNQLDLPVRAITSKPAKPKQPELVDVQITPEPVIFSKGVFKKVLVLSTPVCSIDTSSSTLKAVDPSTGEETPLSLEEVGLTLQTGKSNVELVVQERTLDAATYYLTLQMLYGDCAPGKSNSAPVAYRFKIGS